LANGQVVDAKRVVATRVRVGRFEVANVECTVFGPEYPEAGILLGQSFLGHFVFKIDAENSRLVMTRLDKGPKDKSAGDKSAGDKPGTKK
jgi:predicted aspartyl protease